MAAQAAAAAAAAAGLFVPAEVREAVWKRLNGEAMVPATVPLSYFNRVTRNFAYDAQIPSQSPEIGKLFWAWDVFQGHVTPSLVVMRHFASMAEAQAAKAAVTRIEHDNVRRMICSAEPAQETTNNGQPAFMWVSATELPPKQHSLATYAPDKAEDAEWVGQVISSVRAGLEYLQAEGMRATLTPDSVFLRGGKPDKAYVTQLTPWAPDTPDVETQLRQLTAMVADASGLQFTYTQCINAIDADGTAQDAGGMFDDDLGTPLIFEQVGNCPIVLREKCAVCRTLVRSAGFHMRGVDCDIPQRHFVCEGCVNRRVKTLIDGGDLAIETLPCGIGSCRGSLDFDDFGALLHAPVLREWNRLGRERALKEVEEDVNKRLKEMRESK